MLKLKSLFPDVQGLHARADTLLRNSSVGRVTLVSRLPRNRSKPLLEALVSDPIDDSHWFPQLANRPLSKDILVSQSDQFEFIQTRNSLTEFPVPFRGPTVEILEVSPDSREHIETADLLVELVENGDTAAGQSDFPTVSVLNDDINPPKADSNRFRVNLEEAQRADQLLRKSPKNISQFLELHSSSGIGPLKERIFRPVAELRQDLLQSIVTTCKNLIRTSNLELQNTSKTSEHALSLRTTWTREAHRELQVLLAQYDNVLATKLAWYTLYGRVDDVEAILNSIPVLPQSRVSLEYASGQIDALVQAPHSVRPAMSLEILSVNVRAAATRLHNTGIKVLALTVMGVQAPICAVAAAGVYFQQFSLYAMGGLAALGLVIGFRRMQSAWMAASQKFVQTINEESQQAIAQSETALWSIYEEKRTNQAAHLEEQQKAVSELEKV